MGDHEIVLSEFLFWKGRLKLMAKLTIFCGIFTKAETVLAWLVNSTIQLQFMSTDWNYMNVSFYSALRV